VESLGLVGLHQLAELVVVYPATAVRIDISDHVVNVSLCQIVAKVLQNPPEFVGVDLASLFLVQYAEHLPQFPLVLIILHLLPQNSAELVQLDISGAFSVDGMFDLLEPVGLDVVAKLLQRLLDVTNLDLVLVLLVKKLERVLRPR